MPQYYDEYGQPVDPFADADDSYDDVQPEPQERNPLRAQIRKLEKQNRDLRKQAEAGEQATRKLAFVEAGVDLSNPWANYFVQGYSGEVTPDAVKAAAEPLGLLRADTAAQPQQVQQQMPQQPLTPQQQMLQANDQFQQAQNAYRAINQATDQQMPGTRDFDAEMRAAASTGNRQEVHRILQEKAAANGQPGVPAIVHD